MVVVAMRMCAMIFVRRERRRAGGLRTLSALVKPAARKLDYTMSSFQKQIRNTRQLNDIYLISVFESSPNLIVQPAKCIIISRLSASICIFTRRHIRIFDSIHSTHCHNCLTWPGTHTHFRTHSLTHPHKYPHIRARNFNSVCLC